MIDIEKTTFVTTNGGKKISEIIGGISLRASMLVNDESPEELVKQNIKKAIWAAAYHDLISPIMQLRRAAMMDAHPVNLAEINRLSAEIMRLLEFPASK